MTVITPQRLLEMGDRDTYLVIQRNHMNDALNSLALPVPEEHLTGALNTIRGETGIVLSSADLRRLLDLHPVVRGLVAEHHPDDETDVRDALYDMIAEFFLGTRWPQLGDQIPMTQFLAILKAQASAMDFVTD